jgi:ferrochelatase
MTGRPRTGLLLINLGTPESPDTKDVRPYLREFLMDPRVIDIPTWRRWMLVNLLILPTRPKESGKAYAKVWTDEGSPLLTHSVNLVKQVRKRLGAEIEIELGMRYGNPSIASALDRLKNRGVDQVVVFPLYPQYSSAATGSSVEEVYRAAAKYWNTPNLHVVPPFYDHPAFIEPCAAVARPLIDEIRPEKIFFSFHGLPERQVEKSDESGGHCLKNGNCCDEMVEANRNCYRAQCYATARALAERLGVPDDQGVVCFQSRLGKTPWIRPYTDEILVEEARRGCRRAVILSPAFVADCLETIEELGIRAVEDWKNNGGETLTLAPAVNDRDDWADGLIKIARDSTSWLGADGVTAGAIER